MQHIKSSVLVILEKKMPIHRNILLQLEEPNHGVVKAVRALKRKWSCLIGNPRRTYLKSTIIYIPTSYINFG